MPEFRNRLCLCVLVLSTVVAACSSPPRQPADENVQSPMDTGEDAAAPDTGEDAAPSAPDAAPSVDEGDPPETTSADGVDPDAVADPCALQPCESPGTCVPDGDGYVCLCPNGFESEGDGCADIDECAGAPCHTDAICTNLVGSWECACKDGFQGDGVGCTDVDECVAALDECAANATCNNTPGGYECSCKDGYEGSGVVCSDIDECADAPCDQDCTNIPGDFYCSCDGGWTLGSDGSSCDDVDECQGPVCGPNMACTNSPGSFSCACVPGYQPTELGCTDVDECALSPCDQDCDNEPGGFECSCGPGWALGDDETSCEDVDECALGMADCAADALCTNLVPMDGAPRYACTCPAGKTGDGVVCADIDECDVDNGGCDQICKNLDGGYECSCQDGYAAAGDGACEDIDECAIGQDDCGGATVCKDIEGGWSCVCAPGYVESGGSCVQVDDCAADPCGVGTCTDLVDDYECSCPCGYGSADPHVCAPLFDDILLVDASAPAGGDGSCWEKAFDDLQQALDVAAPGESIWVAKGVYVPGTAFVSTFHVPPGVTLRGGFAGDETHIDEWSSGSPTILSADIEGDDPSWSEDVAYNAEALDDNVDVVLTTTEAEGAVVRDVIIAGGRQAVRHEASAATLEQVRIGPIANGNVGLVVTGGHLSLVDLHAGGGQKLLDVSDGTVSFDGGLIHDVSYHLGLVIADVR